MAACFRGASRACSRKKKETKKDEKKNEDKSGKRSKGIDAKHKSTSGGDTKPKKSASATSLAADAGGDKEKTAKTDHGIKPSKSQPNITAAAEESAVGLSSKDDDKKPSAAAAAARDAASADNKSSRNTTDDGEDTDTNETSKNQAKRAKSKIGFKKKNEVQQFDKDESPQTVGHTDGVPGDMSSDNISRTSYPPPVRKTKPASSILISNVNFDKIDFDAADDVELATLIKQIVRQVQTRNDLADAYLEQVNELQAAVLDPKVFKMRRNQMKLEEAAKMATTEYDAAKQMYREAVKRRDERVHVESRITTKEAKFSDAERKLVNDWAKIAQAQIQEKCKALIIWKFNLIKTRQAWWTVEREVRHTRYCTMLLHERVRTMKTRLQRYKFDIGQRDHRTQLDILRSLRKIAYYKNRVENSPLYEHYSNLKISRQVKYDNLLTVRRTIKQKLDEKLDQFMTNIHRVTCGIMEENIANVYRFTREWHKSGYNPALNVFVHEHHAVLSARGELKSARYIINGLNESAEANDEAFQRLLRLSQQVKGMKDANDTQQKQKVSAWIKSAKDTASKYMGIGGPGGGAGKAVHGGQTQTQKLVQSMLNAM